MSTAMEGNRRFAELSIVDGQQVLAIAEKQLVPSDLDLVRCASRGDRAAFGSLIDRHAASLFRVARSLSRTRSDAEDIVQETLLAAFQGLAGFDGRSSVRTWMTRILMRRAAKAWNRGKSARANVTFELAEVQAAVRGVGEAAPSLSVSSATSQADRKMDLSVFMESLSPEHREVLVLREIESMSYAEIAAELGIPQGTVESRIHRARADLRERFKGYLS